jgi:hypothetical protein
MTTATEIMQRHQITRRDALRLLLENVRDGWTTVDKALEQVEGTIEIVARTALEAGRLGPSEQRGSMKLVEALFLAESADLVRQDKLAEAVPVLVAEIKRLRAALQMIADETIVPDAFPGTWDTYTEAQQSHISALLIAQGALEGSPDQEEV